MTLPQTRASLEFLTVEARNFLREHMYLDFAGCWILTALGEELETYCPYEHAARDFAHADWSVTGRRELARLSC